MDIVHGCMLLVVPHFCLSVRLSAHLSVHLSVTDSLPLSLRRLQNRAGQQRGVRGMLGGEGVSGRQREQPQCWAGGCERAKLRGRDIGGCGDAGGAEHVSLSVCMCVNECVMCV